MIEFQHVSKQYPDGTLAVEDLSLSIPTGAITVFVGPSGCGKTTSLRMINRMIEPTSGTVLVDGVSVSTQPAATLRRSIGYVLQGAGLFPHRTVLDNVATVPVLNKVSKARARQEALGLLERVGLDPALAKRYPAQLSGGQQQRVGVARALAADPPVLLMDEPFSAVDPVVREQLQNELLSLQGELGKTIVLVTHDIDEAVRIGDHVAVFALGGRLAQFATPEVLLTRPADDFVAGFVGRDRGYRALSFNDAADLPVETIDTEIDGLRLTLAADGAPDAWVAADGTRYPVTASWRREDSLRVVADLALLSAAGAAVRVDAAGRADGLARTDEISAAVRSGLRARVAVHAAEPPPADRAPA